MSNIVKPGHVHVSTADYAAEYGHKPRGYSGSWVFAPNRNAPESSYYWGRGMYSEAKTAAQQHFAALGINSIVTLT